MFHDLDKFVERKPKRRIAEDLSSDYSGSKDKTHHSGNSNMGEEYFHCLHTSMSLLFLALSVLCHYYKMMDGPQCTCLEDVTVDYRRAMLQENFIYMTTEKCQHSTTMKLTYFSILRKLEYNLEIIKERIKIIYFRCLLIMAFFMLTFFR